MDHVSNSIAAGYAKHPRNPAAESTYGTAGFRMKAELLDGIMFCVGLLAALRSKNLNGKFIGVMITASHNAAPDNGVKLVDPLGEMLAQSWEKYATLLVKASSPEDLIAAVAQIVKNENIDLSKPANVFVGRDTRPSGATLLAALKDGCSCFDARFDDRGVITTPQLHFLTYSGNTSSYESVHIEKYYKKLAAAYKALVSGYPKQSTLLHVDAANGVGAPHLRILAQEIGSDFLSVQVVNDNIDDPAVLNHQCGADFVKINQKKPSGIDLIPGERYCSLDGDADRIVYYYATKDGTFKLLDGDKIATLAAGFIMDLVTRAGVKVTNEKGELEDVHVGLVQTAYANGSSTRYVKDVLKVPVVFTPTGVKHLHHEAQHFDVGAYFEANGHGTVLFSDRAIKAFANVTGKSQEQVKALKQLQALAEVINQTVGDALSDMLMVEAILTCTGQSLAQWDEAYTDLPSRQEKVKVKDRLAFVPINADTELAKPEGLQAKIVQQYSKFNHGRAFVRPSGTEDIVRVYAEADTRENADLLANIICGLVFDYYGGVGDRPSKYKRVDLATGSY